MVSKFLEKTVEVEYDNDSKIKPDLLELEYYLLECEKFDSEKKEECKTYGIEIVKKHSGIVEENRKYENIFSNRKKIKSLVDLLAENTVTPSSLPYILDDLIGI